MFRFFAYPPPPTLRDFNSPRRFEGVNGMEMLLKLIGVVVVDEVKDVAGAQKYMKQIKTMMKGTDMHKKRIKMSLSYEGIVVREMENNSILFKHAVDRLLMVALDSTDKRSFAYVTLNEDASTLIMSIKTLGPARVVVDHVVDLYRCYFERQIAEYLKYDRPSATPMQRLSEAGNSTTDSASTKKHSAMESAAKANLSTTPTAIPSCLPPPPRSERALAREACAKRNTPNESNTTNSLGNLSAASNLNSEPLMENNVKEENSFENWLIPEDVFDTSKIAFLLSFPSFTEALKHTSQWHEYQKQMESANNASKPEINELKSNELIQPIANLNDSKPNCLKIELLTDADGQQNFNESDV